VRFKRVFADFQKLDDLGRAVLTTTASLRDLDAIEGGPREGLAVALYADDQTEAGEPDELQVDGVLEFDSEQRCWAGRFDSACFRHVSDSL
jgi:hypothetical protein